MRLKYIHDVWMHQALQWDISGYRNENENDKSEAKSKREKKGKWEVFTLAKRKGKIAKWPRQKLEIEIGDDLINFRFLICCWGGTRKLFISIWMISNETFPKNIKKKKRKWTKNKQNKKEHPLCVKDVIETSKEWSFEASSERF